MRYVTLGNTGISVSALSMGVLPMSPAQYGFSVEEGRAIVNVAAERGINFFDVAELYDGYQYLSHLPDDMVISSRCYAFDKRGMEKSVEQARRELKRDRLPIFGLHEQESQNTLLGHKEALDYLCELKEKGVVGAISVSTHHVECVMAASRMAEIDVVFAILNMEGLGVRGGSRIQMEKALEACYLTGKGVYLMKAIGGGHLQERARDALSYAYSFPYKHSVCLGMKDLEELDFAIDVMEGKDTPQSLCRPKTLMVEDWCQGCRECEAVCNFGAIAVKDNVAVIDQEKCLMCGYCARACPHFCIKVMSYKG